MYSVESIDKFNAGKHIIYAISSPVEINRTYKSLIDKMGNKIKIDGIDREIIGIMLDRNKAVGIGDRIEISAK